MFTGLVLSLAALVNGATVSVTPDIVAAGVARASTPYKADRPVSQATVASLLAAYDGSNFTAMWAQADAYDAANSDGTECRAFMLQYEFSLRLMPERVPLRDVFDSLNLNTKCGITPPTAPASTAYFKPLTPSEITATCTAPGSPYYVDATGGSDSNSGTMASPFQTLPKALAATRASGPRSQGQSACIVLRGGVHHLATTMTLGAADSGLVFTALAGDAGGPAWVSGGVPLGPLSWTPYDLTSGRNIYVADISPSVPLSSMPGLNSLSSTGAMPTRFWRARYPNTFDLEQFTGQLPDMGAVEKWVKAPLMDIPEMYFMDLKAAGLKNDSTMQEYNWYQAARGGPCEHWARDGESWSYVCGNSTAGGWEFIEKNFASSGQLGFPVSMVYNKSKLPASFASWTMPTPAARTDWSNTPTLTAWHNQGWFQATYAITGIDTAAGQLTLTADDVFPSGGWQGGRTMESCSAYNTSYEAPLCSGPWYVMNVFQELDYPNEYFFDPTARKLYLFYNDTSGTPPPSDFSLVSQQLEVFFDLSGTPSAPVSDVTFAGLGLRDQRDGQLVKWVDPSGGDWGIRRAGLFHLEGTHRVNITGSTFFRTDANAVMVAAYNRNASVVDCEFAFIGMSAVVTFGQTIQEDGTQGTQPFGTLIAYNKVHEIGAYQLQSSAWFTSRATLTRAEGLVVFNIPRAAINLNDAFGGGNNITLSSIWHTCRQSGDHGCVFFVCVWCCYFCACVEIELVSTLAHPPHPFSLFSLGPSIAGTGCPF